MVYECMCTAFQKFTVTESTKFNPELYSSSVNDAQDQSLFRKTLEGDIFSALQLPCLCKIVPWEDSKT